MLGLGLRTLKNWCYLFISSVVFGTSCTNAQDISADSNWQLDIRIERKFIDNDTDRTQIKPRLRFGRGSIKHELELTIDHPDQGTSTKILEWQLDYDLLNSLILRNEFSRNFSVGSFDSQIKLIHFFNIGNGFELGYELRTNYLKDDEFEIHRIQVDPTIKWSEDVDAGNLSARLKMPVLQLYDQTASSDNFEFVSAEARLDYTLSLSPNVDIRARYKVPYTHADRSFGHEFSLQWGVNF